jgi:hypothetical protein
VYKAGANEGRKFWGCAAPTAQQAQRDQKKRKEQEQQGKGKGKGKGSSDGAAAAAPAGGRCSFFLWADDAPHSKKDLGYLWRRPAPMPPAPLGASASGTSAAPGTDSAGGLVVRHTQAGEAVFHPDDVRQGGVGDCWFLAGGLPAPAARGGWLHAPLPLP